jgi:hypothetical protein
VSSFQKSFLRESGSPSPRAYLAAFGKHPGWNDHIDDLGLDTESLALAKQRIYLEGISTQIDSGAWNKLDSSQLLDGFDHLFLWRRAHNGLLGCLASSSDGKGRTRYPIILCTQFSGIPLKAVLHELRPALETALGACRATDSAETVRQVVGRARESIRSLIARVTADGAPEKTLADAARQLSQSTPSLSDERMLRILYQIKNNLAPWARDRSSTDQSNGAATGVHLRLPRIVQDENEALAVWSTFLGSQLGPNAPLLLVLPRRGEWIDAIIGEPSAADFFGLRANRRAIPCASEVPYDMDKTFQTEATALLSAEASTAAGRTIFSCGEGPPQGQNFAQQAASVRQAARAGFRDRLQQLKTLALTKRKGVMWGLLILLGIGAALIGYSVFRDTRSVAMTPRASSTSLQASGGTLDVGAEWKALCKANYEWLVGLETALTDSVRRERWMRDPYLKTAVLARLGAPGQPSQLDPRVLVGSSESLQSLVQTPPSAVVVPAMAEKIRNAGRVVDEIRNAFTAWPLLAGTKVSQKSLADAGWGNVAEEDTVSPSLDFNGELSKGVDHWLATAPKLAAAVSLTDGIRSDLSKLQSSGDPALIALAPVLERELSSWRSLDELSSALQRLQLELRPVSAKLGTEWTSGKIDRDRFLKERGAAWANGLSGAALLTKWLAEVSQFTLVSDVAARLPANTWQQELASAKNTLSQLAKVAPADTGPFSLRQQKIEKDWAALTAAPVIEKDSVILSEKATALVRAMRTLGADLTTDLGRRANPSIWTQQLLATRIEASAVVNDEWQRQRDALLPQDPEALRANLPKFLELRARAEQVERYLRQLATAEVLPEAFPVEARLDDGIARDLRARMGKIREEALLRLIDMIIWKDGGPAETPEEFWKKNPVRGVVADYQKELGELRGLGPDITTIITLLDEGCAWQDQAGKLFAPWRDRTNRDTATATLPRMAEVLARFAALEKLATSADRAQLETVVRSGKLAESMTAWRRLGELPGWLSEATDLPMEQQMAAALCTRGGREITNDKRRGVFQKDLATQLRSRWITALGRVGSDNQMSRLFDAMESFGVVEADLSSVSRLNLALHRLRAKPWLEMSKDRARSSRDEAVSTLRAAFVGDHGAVQSVLTRLEKVNFEAGGINLAVEGPAKAGWTLEPGARPNAPSYTWKAKQSGRLHQLEFVLVPLPQGNSAYLCTTEFPVQLFIDWAEERKLWNKVIAAQKVILDDFGKLDTRRGPRSYAVKRDGSWENWRFNRDISNWGIGSAERYAPNETVPMPTEQTPINYVSFTAANLIGKDLNCRLPTSVEWQLAFKLERNKGEVTAAPNVRDLRWRKQKDFQASQRNKEKYWPDDDIFLPSSPSAEPNRAEKALVATEKDDGALWFSDVHSGSANLFWHLVGNVAEYVTQDGNQVGVIGGSALSPPELQVDQFYEVDRRYDTTGFSDVGFRLAFSAGEITGAAQVSLILGSAPFLTERR